MTAFDTDVLSEIFRGEPNTIAQVGLIPAIEQFVPIVAIEEILRGRFAVIRHAETGKARIGLPEAYEWLEKILRTICTFQVLPYTQLADSFFKQWRAAKIRIGAQDMRIAAIAVDYGAKLITRNARDFSQIPGLNLEIWK